MSFRRFLDPNNSLSSIHQMREKPHMRLMRRKYHLTVSRPQWGTRENIFPETIERFQCKVRGK